MLLTELYASPALYFRFRRINSSWSSQPPSLLLLCIFILQISVHIILPCHITHALALDSLSSLPCIFSDPIRVVDHCVTHVQLYVRHLCATLWAYQGKGPFSSLALCLYFYYTIVLPRRPLMNTQRTLSNEWVWILMPPLVELHGGRPFHVLFHLIQSPARQRKGCLDPHYPARWWKIRRVNLMIPWGVRLFPQIHLDSLQNLATV